MTENLEDNLKPGTHGQQEMAEFASLYPVNLGEILRLGFVDLNCLNRIFASAKKNADNLLGRLRNGEYNNSSLGEINDLFDKLKAEAARCRMMHDAYLVFSGDSNDNYLEYWDRAYAIGETIARLVDIKRSGGLIAEMNSGLNFSSIPYAAQNEIRRKNEIRRRLH